MRNRAALVAIPIVVAVAILVGLAAANVIKVGKTHPSPSPSGAQPSASIPAAASSSSLPSPAASATWIPMFAGCGPLDENVPLALRVEAIGELGRWWVISVYEDGRVLTPTTLPGTSGDGSWMVARRLSASGIAQLRAAVLDSGFFDHSADYNPVSLPGVPGPAFGGGGYRITIGSGLDAVTVSWTALFPNDEQYFGPSPERAALDPLAERMLAFDSWLTDDGWAERDPCTVQALRFRVFIDAQPNGGAQADLPPDIADVSWPLGGAILSWGAEVGYQPPDEPYHVERCGIAARADASHLVDQLRAAGAFDPFTFPTTLDRGGFLEFELGDRAANRIIQIFIQPLLPDDDRCGRDYRPGSAPI
jgi:hypothetical protein